MRTYNVNGRQVAVLTSEVENFLKGYQPEDMFFTSEEEMETIEKTLRLSECSNVEEARAMRNAVVLFYTIHSEEVEDYMTSMQSVTAVIDYYGRCY